jgi:hypothetical protein
MPIDIVDLPINNSDFPYMGDEDDEPLNLMDSVKVTTGVT